MPCITIQFNPAIGPLINLGIAQPGAVKTAAAEGKPPAFEGCQALVDTGASVTCISREIAQKLELPPAGKMLMASASETREMNSYLVDIALPFGDPSAGVTSIVKSNMTVMEFEPNSQHYQALLGRDILDQALFSMTGYDNRFTICM